MRCLLALLAGDAHISACLCNSKPQRPYPSVSGLRRNVWCSMLGWKKAVPYKAFREAVEDRNSSWRGSYKEGCGCIMRRQTTQERNPSCGCDHTTAQQATGLGIEAPGEAVRIRSRPVLSQLNCLS